MVTHCDFSKNLVTTGFFAPDLPLRRRVLYPAELRRQISFRFHLKPATLSIADAAAEIKVFFFSPDTSGRFPEYRAKQDDYAQGIC